MKTLRFAILTAFVILIFSCKNNLSYKDCEIYGYVIGDSLLNNFSIEKEYGIVFKEVKLKKDSLIRASTIANHIYYFHIKQPVENYYKTIEKIKKAYGKPFVTYIGDTIHGIKLKNRIEYYLWHDSLTNNKIEIMKELKNAKFYNIEITNDSIVEKLSMKYIDGYEKKDDPIEIMVFDDDE